MDSMLSPAKTNLAFVKRPTLVIVSSHDNEIWTPGLFSRAPWRSSPLFDAIAVSMPSLLKYRLFFAAMTALGCGIVWAAVFSLPHAGAAEEPAAPATNRQTVLSDEQQQQLKQAGGAE